MDTKKESLSVIDNLGLFWQKHDDSINGVNDTYNQVKIQDGSGWIITKDWAKDD